MSPTTFNERPASMHELPAGAETHFKLALIGAALRLIEQLSAEEGLREFAFLQSYVDEAESLVGIDPHGRGLAAQWKRELERWESGVGCPLPLRALNTAVDLSADALTLLLTIGLPEEDARFGAIFEWAQPGSPGQQRPTLGLLTAWWRQENDCGSVRNDLRSLKNLGLINVINPESPRIQWAFEAAPLIWDVLRGERAICGLPWLEYHSPDELPTLNSLVLPSDLQAKVQAIPRLLTSGETRAMVVRGPLRNGRKTLIRAIAQAAGYGTLELRAIIKPDDPRWSFLGALCTMLRAIPLFTFELSPGEIAQVPELRGYAGPQGIAVSRHGTIEGPITESALVVELALPSQDARRQLWSTALRVTSVETPKWAEKFRLTSGGIFRSAGLARTQAALEGRGEINEEDVRHAHRALQQSLESQSVRLPTCENWDHIVASPDVLAELRTLEDRCRYREQLASVVSRAQVATVNHGVRALFGGPSGTGKTLAARVLASELKLDLYRLDLSAVVNKYVGETEKNLNQIFSRAEELHVILLLDEGDSLLTNRTAVQSSNDRYANLETNFLLQRIESFEGILFVTTNALQRIDGAFQRRMDVLIEFRLPEADERRQLWNLHLPPNHAVSEGWIHEVARRCPLSGGQIRNASLHASLLALARGSAVSTPDAEKAVLREYQKMGAVCPLRRHGYGRSVSCPA
jgi:ATPase family associated with various cellular activities (AAA)